ncbi:hypothetical protein HYQ46_004037 [Verticillium longisporum]|nr:hypothetical protein HYQ46_004037 [Verticillium longisporum]
MCLRLRRSCVVLLSVGILQHVLFVWKAPGAARAEATEPVDLTDALETFLVLLAFDPRAVLRPLVLGCGASSISISTEAGSTTEASVALLARTFVARFLGAGASAFVMMESSSASLARLRPQTGFAGGGGMSSSIPESTSCASTDCSFLVFVFRALAVVAVVVFFARPPFLLVVEAVVMMLSS